jgi:hypothetical protein
MYRYNRRCSCDRCKSHALMAPAVLVTLGILFLLGNVGNYRLDFDHTWPLLLIVVGGVILARRNASMGGHVDPDQPYVVMPQLQNPPVDPSSSQPPTSEVSHG